MQILSIFEHNGHRLTWRNDGVCFPSRGFFGSPDEDCLHPRAVAYSLLFREDVQKAKTLNEFHALCTLFSDGAIGYFIR